MYRTLKFRNYTPFDNTLKPLRVKKASVPPVVEEIEKKLKDAEQNADKVSLLALAPKKPNFDLKRDVEKKLKKLELKTNKVIYEMISTYTTATSPPHLHFPLYDEPFNSKRASFAISAVIQIYCYPKFH